MSAAELAGRVSVVSRDAALLAGIAAAIWLLIIAVLHLLKPELRPAIRMISEYARPPRGWIMQTAFYCMGIGCFGLALAVGPYISPLGPILLALNGVGFAAAGLFVTDPVFIGEGGATTSGRLHVLFAFAVMMLFPIMATMVDASAAGSPALSSLRGWLPALTALPWVGLAAFVGITIYRARRGDAPVGEAERFLVLTFTSWVLVVAFRLAWL